jgi:DNA-binding response OmpR family regulator
LLNHVSVLVAEDQPFIAMDLALAVEDAGGKVVGPAASCEEALVFLASGIVGAAVLDVNLVDGDCSALVEVLVGLDVPFIVHTAVDLPPALAARFSGLVVQIKPCPAATLVARLEILLAEHKRAIAAAPASHDRGQAVT